MVPSCAFWSPSCTTAKRAFCNCSGNFLPLFSARRSIPAHALELKKNRCGIKVCSSTCDNEHTAASLGHSEILGVKDAPSDCSLGAKHNTSVRPSFPCWDDWIIFAGEASKETAESVVGRAENSRDVFPEDDAGGQS